MLNVKFAKKQTFIKITKITLKQEIVQKCKINLHKIYFG